MRGTAQIATQLRDGSALAISGSTELELGARGMLLLVDGTFRLDARPTWCEMGLAFWGLNGGELTIRGERSIPSATGGDAQLKLRRDLRRRAYEYRIDILDGKRCGRAEIVLGAVQIPERGTTRFTAQAIVQEIGVP
jgi:hypothetical protein